MTWLLRSNGNEVGGIMLEFRTFKPGAFLVCLQAGLLPDPAPSVASISVAFAIYGVTYMSFMAVSMTACAQVRRCAWENHDVLCLQGHCMTFSSRGAWVQLQQQARCPPPRLPRPIHHSGIFKHILTCATVRLLCAGGQCSGRQRPVGCQDGRRRCGQPGAANVGRHCGAAD